MPALLTIENLEKNIGSRMLFDGLNLRIHKGEHAGIIGPNGSGKSTLLKIITGLSDADDGEIRLKNGLKLAYLPQVEPINPELNLLEYMIKPDFLDDANPDSDAIFEREIQAQIVLSQVGFDDISQKTGTLSGGWLKRLAIAKQIAKEPDFLLLDEPTNHLDFGAIEWLQELLSNAKFSWLLVTHDRYLLNKSTNRVIEINSLFDGGSLSFDCSYNDFLQRRADILDSERQRAQSLSNKNRREQEWVKAGVKARTTKQKGRLKTAASLDKTVKELHKRTKEPDKIKIEFDTSKRQSKRLLVARNICKSYDNGEKIILKDLDINLTGGTRLGLLGGNGTGKSTLIRVLAGEDGVDSGELKATTGVKTLHFDQKRENLDNDALLKEALNIGNGDMVSYRGKNLHIASWAKKLKFRTDQLQSPISSLSGGERARVIIGRLMQQQADILLLDEPTNDLDIPAIEVLEESLSEFPGAVVLVTHDREMLDRVSTELLAFDGNGGLEKFASYAQWRKFSLKNKDEISPKNKKKTDAKTETDIPKKATKKRSYMEQRELDSMEEKILNAENRLEKLQKSAVSYEDGADKFANWCQSLDEAQSKIDRLYERWNELEG